MIPGSYYNGFAPRDRMPMYPSLWQGCVGAWAPCLGPTGLTLRDCSAYKNHGTLTNGPTWQVSEGRYAINCDGSNDWVDVGNAAFFGTLPRVTISMWIKATAAPLQFDSIGGCTTTSDLWNNGWGFYFQSPTVLRFFVASWNTTFAASAATTFTNLVHVAGLWDGANARIFINGVEGTASSSVTSYASGVYGLTIGKITTASELYNFNGNIDDVRVYNRALSLSEIRLLASRRGIAYDLAPFRMPYSEQVAAARLRRLLLLGVGS